MSVPCCGLQWHGACGVVCCWCCCWDLDIAVNDVLAVCVGECSSELLHVASHSRLRQRSASLELLVQFTMLRVLEHQIHVGRVEEVSVQPQYVTMAQMALNFHFAPQLRLHSVSIQLLYAQHLHCTDKSAVLMAC